jgi:hypothetical protein
VSIRRLLVISLFFLNSACSGISEHALRDSPECEAGITCRIEGKLQVFPGGVGSGTIRGKGFCYDLALPKDVLQNFSNWNGKFVVVSGEAIWRPQLSDASWFDIRDRRIEGVGCGEVVIYVGKVLLLNGKK